MNTAALLLAATLSFPPGDRGSTNTSSMLRIRVGPTVQNRAFILREFGRRVIVKGNNNVVYLQYSPDAGINYYNKQKWVNRRPLFWRFRRGR